MRYVYLSFLGTSDYTECYYQRGDFKTEVPVRFVQEATVADNCRQWTADDRIFIFTTEEAKKKNWLDNGHLDPKTKQPLEREGLARRLDGLGLAAPFLPVDIPNGHNESEIWEIFHTIFTMLQDGDQVVFDITHAFRSIPLLATSVLQYAKVMKGIRLKGVYYGAFEVLGTLAEAKNRPVTERVVPILNLTALDQLMDWSAATERFVEGGDPRKAGQLAQESVAFLLSRSRGRDAGAQAIRSLGQSLDRFGWALFTCRGPEISRVSVELKQKAAACRDADLVAPFRPLFARIEERLEPFRGDPISDGLAAVRWCCEHNLIQQGYTFLEEILFSHIVRLAGGDPLRVEERESASQAFTIVNRKWEEKPERWESRAGSDMDRTRAMIRHIKNHGELYKLVERLRVRRNDINHAGFKPDGWKVSDAWKFAAELDGFVKEVECLMAEREQSS
jgi:CRISPR-associated Csx2 family protein